ncbi:hypothetical protein AUJ65_02960 [Candidatus Micrarchaeota archaeon CG1_02_51_15]|nr:MAG: hypothetical protein AUJ65_02960 [Candidatus Micrarchaeota archaeon CG1_02_51_15]
MAKRPHEIFKKIHNDLNVTPRSPKGSKRTANDEYPHFKKTTLYSNMDFWNPTTPEQKSEADQHADVIASVAAKTIFESEAARKRFVSDWKSKDVIRRQLRSVIRHLHAAHLAHIDLMPHSPGEITALGLARHTTSFYEALDGVAREIRPRERLLSRKLSDLADFIQRLNEHHAALAIKPPSVIQDAQPAVEKTLDRKVPLWPNKEQMKLLAKATQEVAKHSGLSTERAENVAGTLRELSNAVLELRSREPKSDYLKTTRLRKAIETLTETREYLNTTKTKLLQSHAKQRVVDAALHWLNHTEKIRKTAEENPRNSGRSLADLGRKERE